MSAPDEYTRLITSQHQKPRFTALVTALIEPVTDAQNLLDDLSRAFDVDTAVGAQLDAVGEWIGRSRVLAGPLTGVYFAWGDADVGWGKGAWRGQYDPTTGLTALPDDIYRRLLKAKIAANAWDGTIPGAYDVWRAAFEDTGGLIVLQDNQDMSMSVGLAGMPLDAVTKRILLAGAIPLKPEGVCIEWYAVTPSGGALFAWGCDGGGLAGWGQGQWPEVLRP